VKSLIRLFKAIPNKGLLLVPQAMYWLGAFLNQLVLAANNGQMPVLFPGGCPAELQEALEGSIHTCMTSASHLKILADWINVHIYIMSIGDVLLGLGDLFTGPLFWCWLTLALLEVRPKD
jgi:Family of unknown function (DUF5317)